MSLRQRCRRPCAAAIVASLAMISSHRVYAVPLLFDFGNATPGTTATPFTETLGGITLTLSSDQDPGGFEVDTSPFATFTGLTVDSPGPASATGAQLTLTFSQPVSSITIPFATFGNGPLQLTADDMSGTPLGSNSASGVVPAGNYVFPEGSISFTDPGITSVILFDNADPYFAIGPITVDTAIEEPASLAVIGFALVALLALHRRLRPHHIG